MSSAPCTNANMLTPNVGFFFGEGHWNNFGRISFLGLAVGDVAD